MPVDYKVGYKKPPTHTRFKKGLSGNPNGRPKGTKNLKTELMEELQELILVTEGGSRRTVSKQRAMLKSLTAKAVQGDARAATILVNLVLRLIQQDEDTDGANDLSEEDLTILEHYEMRLRRRAHAKEEKTNDN